MCLCTPHLLVRSEQVKKQTKPRNVRHFVWKWEFLQLLLHHAASLCMTVRRTIHDTLMWRPLNAGRRYRTVWAKHVLKLLTNNETLGAQRPIMLSEIRQYCWLLSCNRFVEAYKSWTDQKSRDLTDDKRGIISWARYLGRRNATKGLKLVPEEPLKIQRRSGTEKTRRCYHYHIIGHVFSVGNKRLQIKFWLKLGHP